MPQKRWFALYWVLFYSMFLQVLGLYCSIPIYFLICLKNNWVLFYSIFSQVLGLYCTIPTYFLICLENKLCIHYHCCIVCALHLDSSTLALFLLAHLFHDKFVLSKIFSFRYFLFAIPRVEFLSRASYKGHL